MDFLKSCSIKTVFQYSQAFYRVESKSYFTVIILNDGRIYKSLVF